MRPQKTWRTCSLQLAVLDGAARTTVAAVLLPGPRCCRRVDGRGLQRPHVRLSADGRLGRGGRRWVHLAEERGGVARHAPRSVLLGEALPPGSPWPPRRAHAAPHRAGQGRGVRLGLRPERPEPVRLRRDQGEPPLHCRLPCRALPAGLPQNQPAASRTRARAVSVERQFTSRPGPLAPRSPRASARTPAACARPTRPTPARATTPSCWPGTSAAGWSPSPSSAPSRCAPGSSAHRARDGSVESLPLGGECCMRCRGHLPQPDNLPRRCACAAARA